MAVNEQISSDYIADVQAFRDEMEAQMRSPGPGGWLALVGMYPLKKGENTVGSAPDSDILLPEGGAPERLGIIDFDGEHGTLHVTTDETVYVDEEPVRDVALRNYYERGGMSVVRVRDVRFGILQWASDPYNVRVWDANAPKRLNFKGREWYDIDPACRVQGMYAPYACPTGMVVKHTGGGDQTLVNIGFVEFELNGQSFHFEAARSEKGADYVWILLRDGTSGKDTYGAGRFLHARLDDNYNVDLDFNKLYQPPCAFSVYTTCPMPPRQNVLPFPLEVGEHNPTN